MAGTTTSAGHSRWPNFVLAAAGAALLIAILTSPGRTFFLIVTVAAGAAIIVAALAISVRRRQAVSDRRVDPGAIVAVITVIVIGLFVTIVIFVGVH